MKKKWVCLGLLLPLLFLLFAMPATAVEEDELLSSLLATLPSEVADALEEQRRENGTAALVGAEQLAALALDALRGELNSSAAYFMRLVGVALLLAVLSHLHAAIGGGGAGRAAECGIGVLLIFLLYRATEGDVARAAALVEDMRRFSDGLAVAFASLFAAGGSSGTAVAAAGTFTILSYLLTHIVAGVLEPFLRLLFALTVIGAVSKRQGLDGVFRALKQLYVTLLSFIALLLTASLAFQSTLSSASDTMALHSVRFAVGNLVPLVGGALGGTLRTLSATLQLLKSTAGALSVAALLALLLPTLIGLLLHRFFLSLAEALSGVLGSERAGGIFRDFRVIYDLAAATLAVVLVLFLFIIGILARCSMAIGGI